MLVTFQGLFEVEALAFALQLRGQYGQGLFNTDDTTGNRVAPATNGYYTWFRTTYRSENLQDPSQTNYGQFMSLTPSQVESGYQGQMNPPTSGQNNEPHHLQIDWVQKQWTSDSNPCTDNVGPCDSGHTHQTFEVGISVGSFNQQVQDFAKAAAYAKQVQDAEDNWLKSSSMKDFLKKEFHFGGFGGVVSWILDVMQTGNALSLRAAEQDHEIPHFRSHWTEFATVPSLPLDLGFINLAQVPVQVMNPSGNFDAGHNVVTIDW